jgi:hypothetical protein
MRPADLTLCVQQKGSYEDYEKCIIKYFGPNPVDFGTEMIAAFGGCTGVSGLL